MFSLSRLLTGRASQEEREATEREIREHKGQLRDNLQAVKSGTTVLNNLSNAIALGRGQHHENRK